MPWLSRVLVQVAIRSIATGSAEAVPIAMPRSLASCYENLVRYLDDIANAYGRQGPAQRQARSIRTRLENSRIDEIFQRGLHEFIGGFIADNNRLGAAITDQYLV